MQAFLGLFIGYAAFSGVRKSLSVSTPGIIHDTGISKVEIGLFHSGFASAYGISKLFTGVLTDFVSARNIFCLGLIFSGCFAASFAYFQNFQILFLIWFLHGLVQGAGWPSLAKIIMDFFPLQQRGKVWSLLTAAGNLGQLVAPLIMVQIMNKLDWKPVFLFFGIFCIIIGLFIFPLLPSDCTNIQTSNNQQQKKEVQAEKNDTINIFYTYLLKNSEFWKISIANALNYLVLKGLTDWIPMFLIEEKGFHSSQAMNTMFWFEVGGLIGSLLSGLISDLLGKRLYVCSAFTFGAVPTIILLMDANASENFIFVLLTLSGIGFNAPKTLCGIAAREVVTKRAQGTAGGIVGIIGQLGASLAGAPLGYVVEQFGWIPALNALVGVGFINAVLLLFTEKNLDKYKKE